MGKVASAKQREAGPPANNSAWVERRNLYVYGPSHGEVAEWSNAPDSKSGVPQGTGGSNPSLSAIFPL